MEQGFFDVIKDCIPSLELVLKSFGFIGTLFVCYFIVSNVSRYICWEISSKFPPEHQYVGQPLHQMVKILLLIPTVIAFLWWWGLDVGHLVISASLLGSVILFILKDPIENTMSAFLLIVQYKLKHDQEITIIGSKGNNYSGKLISLDLGHVFLQDKNCVYIIPNGMVSSSVIQLKSKDAKELTASFLKRREEEKELVKKLKKEGKVIMKTIEKI